MKIEKKIIHSLSALELLVGDMRSDERSSSKAGNTIVLTNGVFDLLHVGHIRFLEQAKSCGDILIVGMNSDKSVRRLKGPRRPILPEDQRLFMLASLQSVDYVCLFGESTAENIVERLRPDVYVKAGYDIVNLPEARIVSSYGGEVILASYTEGYSTSRIIDRILSVFVQEDIDEGKSQ